VVEYWVMTFVKSLCFCSINLEFCDLLTVQVAEYCVMNFVKSLCFCSINLEFCYLLRVGGRILGYDLCKESMFL
jgi:hypothetical protein